MPNVKEIKRELLRLLKLKKKITPQEAYEELRRVFNLSDEEYNRRYKNSGERIFTNRVRFARQHLKEDGLLYSPRQGIWALNEDESNDDKQKGGTDTYDINLQEDGDIVFSIESLSEEYNNKLKLELKHVLSNVSWDFFEKLVVDLLNNMGYGNTANSIAFRMGSDGGVDGEIYLDHLGLEKVYVQAKKWTNNVGSDVVNNFLGALDIKGANKGVIVTTSDFTDSARKAVQDATTKTVALINGDKLVDLMMKFKLGVYEKKTFTIYDVDQDYFNE